MKEYFRMIKQPDEEGQPSPKCDVAGHFMEI